MVYFTYKGLYIEFYSVGWLGYTRERSSLSPMLTGSWVELINEHICIRTHTHTTHTHTIVHTHTHLTSRDLLQPASVVELY